MEFKSEKTALILEGGALRSLFTCGVLDAFMENDIYFPSVCGVSAGSMCAISYLSKQIGRTAKVNLDYANDKRYMSFRSLIKNKTLFNFDFMLGKIAYELIPLDFETLNNSQQKLFVFTTDCTTGKSVAHNKSRWEDISTACRASCSMPLLSESVEIEGHKYLDGGISDPIPFRWALKNGYEKIVLILTRDINYRKKEQSSFLKRLYNKSYKDYPALVETMYNIPKHYNALADEITELEKKDKIFVIRPQQPVRVKRTEKDKQKLQELYEIGRKIGKEMIAPMTDYLNR